MIVACFYPVNDGIGKSSMSLRTNCETLGIKMFQTKYSIILSGDKNGWGGDTMTENREVSR